MYCTFAILVSFKVSFKSTQQSRGAVQKDIFTFACRVLVTGFFFGLLNSGDAVVFFPPFWYTEDRLDRVRAGDVEVVDLSTDILLALDVGALNSSS